MTHSIALSKVKYIRFLFSLLIYAIFVLVGILLIIGGCLGLQSAINFDENKAVATIGIVTGTTYHTTQNIDSNGHGLPVTTAINTIEFKTKQGEIVEFDEQDFCFRGCRGEKVEVLYDPDDPYLAMVKGGDSPLCKVVKFIVMGIVFTAGGGEMIWDHCTRKR